MSDRKYGLYKRIMKHDPKAIDEIKTLEEAKEIIKMMTGNVYLNGEIYQFESSAIPEKLKEYKSESLEELTNIEEMIYAQRNPVRW